MPEPAQSRCVDVVGVGINATDTIIRLPEFPAPDTKVELLSVDVKPGGQVASAIVACARWGLRARYVGKIGDDGAAKLQIAEMQRERVDAHWITSQASMSQTSFILVDQRSGERTVLWKRDARMALRPEDLKREWISGARALLVDGHDTEAAARAACWARAENIPVVGDFDNRYAGVEGLLQYVDYPLTSKEFPERLTGESNLLKSLPRILKDFKCRLIGATIGRFGVIAWDGARFILCPGFRVAATDTTGAGDIFHGAFLYGLMQGWQNEEILEFSCAAAALNCQASGARGGIATLEAIVSLRRTGARSPLAYTLKELLDAAPGSPSKEQGESE
jgi:sulfofructose kinase